MVAAGTFKTALPCTASHEGAGTIVATGSAVSEFSEGDRVMCGLPLHPCGICDDCNGPEEHRQYCTRGDGVIGVQTHGAFSEYVLVDSRTGTVKLPDSVSFETAAPLACAGITVFRALLQTGLKTGEWLCLVGAGGGLGHRGIQFAKAMGLKVVGIDARDLGLALAKETGVDVVVDARKGKEAAAEEVQKVTGGGGADATVNLSDAKGAAALACAVTKMHGLVVQIAQPDEISVPFKETIFRDIRIHGSLTSSPAQAAQMIDAVAKHRISVTTNPVYGLEAIPQLVELSHGGRLRGKGIVIVDRAQVDAEKEKGVELV
ncbi:uncharacterized protein K452DRAFT_288377 [Aplosporella prunicola CBS 121167]|uniref:Enoyl reductase (ER) domain-containing protein n=1 Tax=Aplosporella prunicola CBS 121167 TaxID=1176127 RepID=A0A6A6BC97_9PEZI|nr:uncharacterized protein K452DRAFT_288377 [Aplosporella prunicola CBS 121167]KAF2140993.1 hypothetical protein K452DRAFT_288377 [Aplosporella prunicola CBS 121167]